MQLNGKLLVVDDQDVMREFLLEVFAPYQPLGAKNGMQAMQMVQSEDVAMVISDLKMPEMDGLELLRKIKEYRNDIKVIIITGYASAKTAADCIEAGASDFLKKPFSISQIKEAVKKLTPAEGSTP